MKGKDFFKNYISVQIKNTKTGLSFYGYDYKNDRNCSIPNTFQNRKIEHWIKNGNKLSDLDILKFKLKTIEDNGVVYVVNYIKSKSLRSEVYREFIKHYSESEMDLIPLSDFEVIKIDL